MSKHTTTQCVMFEDLLDKPVHVQFDDECSSSDGGAILLKAAEAQLDLIGPLAGCLSDARQDGKVQHSLESLLAQRTYALCCGYADGNDASKLASDPIFKLLPDRDPLEGFLDAMGVKYVVAMGKNSVLKRFAEPLMRKARSRSRQAKQTEHFYGECRTTSLCPRS